MFPLNFTKYEISEENGHTKIILHVNVQSHQNDHTAEFSAELGTVEQGLKKRAINYVQKQLPKIKKASILIVAGATIITSFPMKKAEAHEVEFNMSYLYFGNTQSYVKQVDSTEGNLNLVSPSYFDLNLDGTLKITSQFDPVFVTEMHKRGIKVVPFLSNHWDRNLGRAALTNREKLTTQIAEFIMKNNLDGVQVDIENVTDIDRDQYTDLVKLLNEKLPKEKEVSVAVAANPNGWTKGWHGSYDYTEIAKHSDYLMIMAYDESYTGSPEGPVASYDWVERSIQYAIKQDVPSNKIVLGIPFYGRYWKVGETSGGVGISNNRVDEMIARYGGKVEFDEKTKSPKAIITIKEGDPSTTIAGKKLTPGTYHIWFENHESIQAKLTLLHKYELKGTGSWSLGQESTSIWKHYRTWLSHDGKATSPPSELQTEQVDKTKTSIATYVVKAGDSLWKIAQEHHMSINQLKELNELSSDIVYVGQTLQVTQNVTNVQKPIVNEPAAHTPGAISAPAQEAVTPKSEVKTTPPPPKHATTVKPTPAPKVTILKYGSKGTAVIDLQNKLRTTGIYKGKSHGTFDTATRNAVIAFQKKYKLKADGIAGTATISKLSAVTKPKVQTSTVKKYPTLKIGSKGSAVVDMQNKLKTVGIYKGKSHGTYDTATKNAVIAFQKKYKLKADGIANPTMLSKLDTTVKSTPKKAVTVVKKTYPTLRVGSKGTAVTDLQNKLRKSGQYKGKSHGRYDNATKNAVIAFQKKYKLKSDGIAGPATHSKINAIIK
ncbi:peptidoglycan-binding protein [Metabacillus malikii]|uniref:Spore germination protein YaaH/peptidoglycan hydrolase-like protein with peptidoglycan-binding domain n=1 Tax=Metabacillus malikii TaxID=1504265 RepID=A0ABT9Z9P3_9BACI|nr:peptidoglycan-binding protein [Metabacillus malikii]MDQ0228962.1 spore germination protein YaaH/peptidoglycan hydrolase-like protein with peptidoglycan-binding domain [Metabacillus malikii]